MKSYTLLDILTLNLEHKINSINFIYTPLDVSTLNLNHKRNSINFI
jgi:hypothetical protein